MKTRGVCRICAVGLVAASGLVAGCVDARPSLVPNPDPSLRRTSAQFAADAVKRHPYKSDAPRRGEAVAGAEVGYGINRLDITNLSDETWNDVEVWVNQNWVVFLPTMEPRKLKRLNFQMLYDDNGRYFPLNNTKVMITEVTILRDGKIYTVPVRLSD